MSAAAPSVAQHLRSQEYARLRTSASALLTEPTMSDESAMMLVDAYARDDLSATDYLAMVSEHRPFTPVATTHAVLVDSGAYCASTAVPVILKSFLHDHGNPEVADVISDYGVVMMEKLSSGGVLVHVRSAQIEQRLAGQEVHLLGRKFTIKRRSPFVDKFFLDISGIQSPVVANDMFLAFCELGARPLFFTPRDVNMASRVVTPTWRFYFGSSEAPSCLCVSGFVTHQLIFRGKFFFAKGRRCPPPPERATRSRASRYSVELPGAGSAARARSEQPVPTVISPPVGPALPQATPAPPARTEAATPRLSVATSESIIPATDIETASCMSDALDELVAEITSDTRRAPPSEESTATPPSSSTPDLVPSLEPNDWVSPRVGEVHAPAGDADDVDSDEDMDKNMESGFKRAEKSFADSNPYAVLENFDYDLEVVHSQLGQSSTSGLLLIPHCPAGDTNEVAAPTAKRSKKAKSGANTDESLSQLLTRYALEAQAAARHDRVDQAIRRLPDVHKLHTTSKNLDQVVQSMKATPLAWSATLCSDIAGDGNQTMELAEIHLLNRLTAAAMPRDSSSTFHSRVTALCLPTGTTRSHYVRFLTEVTQNHADQVREQWKVLHYLSVFELLALCMCPVLFSDPVWVRYVVGRDDTGIQAGSARLLSDPTLLLVLRSSLGLQLVSAVAKLAPTSTVLSALGELRDSSVDAADLAALNLQDLLPVQASGEVPVAQRN